MQALTWFVTSRYRRARVCVLAGALVAVAFAVSGRAIAATSYRAGTTPPPQVLPDGSAHTAQATARWLIGAVDTAATRQIARRHGARIVLRRRAAGGLLTASVPASAVYALADDLSRTGLLRYSEPDARMRRAARARAFAASLPTDPLSGLQWWPGQLVHAEMTPPAVGPDTPWLAVIDSQLDTSHPEALAGNLVAARAGPITDEHGTAVAATAAAPANGVGIVGLWPGLPTRVYASGLSCGSIAEAIDQASQDGAAVINMSFGSPSQCYTLYLAVTAAAGSSVMVASGGNEFDIDNTPVYPASWPHVLTVAAVDSNLESSFFSNENAGIDLAAPGQGILTAVPIVSDTDGVPDGYTFIDGTSFSAPLAAAAAAWTATLQPDLSPDQIAWALTYAARDLGRRGWDQRFGWGLLQVSGELANVSPPYDYNEPNDDMQFINGDVFGSRDAPALTLRGRRSDRLLWHLDDWEDPNDVYWLDVPGRSSFRVSMRMRHGDADLFAYAPSVPTINARRGFRRRGLIASSLRPGRRTDSFVINNRGGPGRVGIAARIFLPHSSLDADYALSARRVGR